MATQTPSIERAVTKLWVPYLDGRIAFAHPFEGPNDYRTVGKGILDNETARLSLPDGEQTAFLLHAVYCGPEEFQAQPESIYLRDEIMKPRNVWVFNRNLWVPGKNEGVYVQFDPNVIGFSQKMDVDDLEKELEGGSEIIGVRFSKDKRTAFAPRETYKDADPEDFAKDGFIIASFGEQGAKKLAEISQSKHFEFKKPHSWVIKLDKEPVQTVPALCGCSGCRLDFSGYYQADVTNGYASGVIDERGFDRK